MRRLFAISVFWLALSMLFDGMNALLLPAVILNYADDTSQASVLGLMTFVGLVLGMVVQPFAGVYSDRTRHRWGRKGIVTLGAISLLVALAFFGASSSLLMLAAAYLLIQLSASIAQAGQQGFIPDLVPMKRRGLAAGLKGFMDIGGALLAFALLGQFLGAGRLDLALLAIGLAVLVTLALTLILVREPRLSTPKPEPTRIAHAFHLDLQSHRPFVAVVIARFLFLLGTYGIGRFLLFFVADRLGLSAEAAAEQAGILLMSLTLVTVIASPLAGWSADRFGRSRLMSFGALLSAIGALGLIAANSTATILLAGALMAVGSGAFSAANWALAADLVPPGDAARFLALANIGTAGAAAAAGLFGPLIDWSNTASPGNGYTILFVLAAAAFLGSIVPLRGLKEQTKAVPAADMMAG